MVEPQVARAREAFTGALLLNTLHTRGTWPGGPQQEPERLAHRSAHHRQGDSERQGVVLRQGQPANTGCTGSSAYYTTDSAGAPTYFKPWTTEEMRILGIGRLADAI